MTRRGKVLRDPYKGPGLLMSEGQQYPFSLDGVWKSEVPPRPGLVVDVELDASGQVHAIRVVPDSQLAREQANAKMKAARENLAPGIVARIGLPNLFAAGLLVVGWFFLTAVSLQTPLGRLSFTFWEVLGLLDSNNTFEALMQGERGDSAGIYGIVAVAVIAGPFLHLVWKKKKAILAGLLPLLFMIFIALMIGSNVNSQGTSLRPRIDSVKPDSMKQEAMKTAHLGPGTYLAIVSSLYSALASTRQFLAARAREEQKLPRPNRLAA